MADIPNFTPKDWRDFPSRDTPISAAALEDQETRVSTYARSVGEAVEDTLETALLTVASTAAVAAAQATADAAIPGAQRGAAGGVAGLNGAGKVVDAAGNVVAGGSAVPAGNRASYLGDSTLTQGGPDATSWTQSWPGLVAVLTSQRCALGINAAVSGTTSSGMLNTYLPIVLADPLGVASKVVIGIGTNDIATGTGGIAAGITPSQTRANIAATCTAIRGAGSEPVLCTIPPRNTSATPTVVDVHAKTQAHNAWLKGFAEANKIALIDVYGLCVDPATGDWKTPNWSSDGIHPSYFTCGYIAELVASHLEPTMPEWRPPLAAAFDDPGNLAKNGLFTADTDADGVPDFWTVSGATNLAVTTAVRPGFVGKAMRLTQSTGSMTGTVTGDAITTGFAVGNKLMLGFKLRVDPTGNSSSEAVNYIVQWLFKDGGGATVGTFRPMWGWRSEIPVVGTSLQEAVVPAGTTQIVPSVSVTGSQGTVDIGQFTIRNLTTA